MKFSAAAAIAALSAFANAQTLVETLTAAGASTLLALVGSEPAILKALTDPAFKGTVFAPTNDALTATVNSGFNASDLTALASVLTYHVTGTVFSGDASLFTANKAFVTSLEGSVVAATSSASGISLENASPAANVVRTHKFDGGYVHVIDSTLLPPANVVKVATDAKLTALLSTLTTAGLADTVAGLKNVTILAPTDAAFAAIADVAKGLTADQLKQVLLAHVVPGIIPSTAIIAAKSIPAVGTLDGSQTLAVSFDGTNVLISGAGNKTPAKVAAADVLADNVIVHVIDTVLLPNFTAPAPAATTPSKVNSASTVGAGLVMMAAAMFL